MVQISLMRKFTPCTRYEKDIIILKELINILGKKISQEVLAIKNHIFQI